ncbi:MAG: CinA family protein [Candidatus Gastranaerophilaceae bacterium]
MTLEEELGKYLIENKLTIATAESCTGGLLSSKLTDVSGSSEYVKLNFVTYANEAKHKILGVSWDILNNFGAVSEECAEAMANGLYEATDCDIALCTTGIAGPTGGTHEKPVGLVYISMRYKGIVTVKEVKLSPTLPRIEMKEQFANQALKLALDILTRDRI